MGKGGLLQVNAAVALSLIFLRDGAPAGWLRQEWGGLVLPIVSALLDSEHFEHWQEAEW